MTQVVDLKPLPLAHGQRIHGLHLPDAAVGVGYMLLPVMNERGLERTFSWLTGFRRLSRDFERFARTIEAIIYACLSRLMLARLTRIA